MRKFAVALASALAVSALTAGAANAQCPPVSQDGKDSAGAPVLPGFEVGTGNPVTIYGEDPLGLGHGESVIGVTGSGVTYDGQLAGIVGHGDIEDASAGTGGVHGSSDGQLGGGLVSGSGSLHVTTAPSASLSVGGTVVGDCRTVTVP